MQITNRKNTPLVIDSIKDFNLHDTLTCGQCFRWKQQDDTWVGNVFGKEVQLSYRPSALSLTGVNQEEYSAHWVHYLSLDEDYALYKKQLSFQDDIMTKAVSFGTGLRLLKQDIWETLISFIISQNNGIPRITKIIDTLCRCFGNEIAENVYAFPTPEQLAKLNSCDMDSCKAGYRTAYVIKTANQVLQGEVNLYCLRDLPYLEARENLMKLHGVGMKVADCTLLFSGYHPEAFPVDRWVLRVMAELYPESGDSIASIQAFASEKWGKLAGLAQEYLFYYVRNKK